MSAVGVVAGLLVDRPLYAGVTLNEQHLRRSPDGGGVGFRGGRRDLRGRCLAEPAPRGARRGGAGRDEDRRLLVALVLCAVRRPRRPPAGAELFRGRLLGLPRVDERGMPSAARRCVGVGAAAADFYLSTGRMPLDDPRAQPERARRPYPGRQIARVVAFVASFGGPAGAAIQTRGRRRGRRGRRHHGAVRGCHQAWREAASSRAAPRPPLRRAGRRAGGRGGPHRPVGDAAVLGAAARPARAGLGRARRPVGRRGTGGSRRLGDRPPRPDARRHGRVAARPRFAARGRRG